MAHFSVKGKGKARNEDGDLSPIITYRHLLTNNMGVLDPLRVVALCDMDAFYASAERVRLGIDPALPLAVQQWQSLIAVNYPARTYGISRMDTVADARKKCPELVLVHTATYREGETEPAYHENPNVNTHKVSLDHYRRESMRIMKMHLENIPEGGGTEKASIDEAFFDFTVPVKRAILSRHPELGTVPPNAPDGLDTPLPPPPPIDWTELGNVVPVSPPQPLPADTTDVLPDDRAISPEDIDDASERIVSGESMETTTWHDVALSIAARFMLQMRLEVKERLGYTTSAGLARNKSLAKVVASFKKHDQQSILRNCAIPTYLAPMPFQKIRFLGGKLGEALADEFEAKTVGDVLNISLDEMQRKFGEESIWVYNILRGIDHTEVKDRIDLKSMLASKNVRPPITKTDQAMHWLRVLAGDLSVRLIEGREQAPTLWPKTLVLHIRQVSEGTRSKQCAFPFSRDVSPDLILRPAEKLWKELTGGRGSGFSINNLSLAFSGLEALETGQTGIEGFFAKPPPMENVLGKRKDSPFEGEEIVVVGRGGSAKPSSSGVPGLVQWFKCERCKKRIHLPKEKSFSEPTQEEVKGALERLKIEHNDFHFAQELARERVEDEIDEVVIENGQGTSRRGSTQPAKRKKVGAQGIAKYFEKATKK